MDLKDKNGDHILIVIQEQHDTSEDFHLDSKLEDQGSGTEI